MSPMLDVSVALTNPYTLDTFIVWRRKQIMNNSGEAKMSVEEIPNVRGVVYPEGANDLSRRAEAQMNTKTIVVITRYPMRGEAETVDGCEYQPDVVIWNADSFVVSKVEDYSNFARGFVKFTCESIDIVDAFPRVR